MTRLFVTIVAAFGAYVGTPELWSGCERVAFLLQGFPVTWQLLATAFVAGLALSIGK